MDAKTREALEASIKHWEENVDAESAILVKLGCHSCALCKLFRDDDCIWCPVKKKTGEIGCIGSPYGEVCEVHDRWKHGEVTSKEWRKAAQAELDFLISLRPEGK